MTYLAGVAIVLVAVGFLAHADRAFYRLFKRGAAAIRAEAGTHDGAAIAEGDLRGLPEPIQRYMRFTGVVGRRRMSVVRVFHSGMFKPGKDGKWAPIKGEYQITTRQPSFAWSGKIAMFPGLTAVAFDSYFKGKGRMLVKLVSAFTVVDAQSRETTLSAAGRCLAELTMAPTFFLDRRVVAWQQTGPDSARCRMDDGAEAVEADFFVNPDGSLAKVTLMRYFDTGKGTATPERFTGQTSNPRDFDGLIIPTRYQGYWNLQEGDLKYVDFTLDRVEWE